MTLTTQFMSRPCCKEFSYCVYKVYNDFAVIKLFFSATFRILTSVLEQWIKENKNIRSNVNRFRFSGIHYNKSKRSMD
ncbi:unnamed protein product [Rhizophagus irregularis]|nr:unnamed protein product [Rhizophagus irregularis]